MASIYDQMVLIRDQIHLISFSPLRSSSDGTPSVKEYLLHTAVVNRKVYLLELLLGDFGADTSVLGFDSLHPMGTPRDWAEALRQEDREEILDLLDSKEKGEEG